MTDAAGATSRATFSCVVDSAPGMAYSAWVWAISLTTLGGQDPSALAVHFVDGCAPGLRRFLEELGARTESIGRFDSRHPPSNKLGQLFSPALSSNECCVLTDCDIAFCGDVSRWVSGERIRARTVDVAGFTPRRWRHILAAAGLDDSAQAARGAATVEALDGEPTIAAYCNGGFLVLPKSGFSAMRDAWPRWNRWLLGRPEVLRGGSYHVDQVSFALACLELELDLDLLPPELNLPTHVPSLVGALGGIEPRVLHFHQALDPGGRLKPTGVASIDARIAEVNAVIRERQAECFDPALLRGVGAGAGPVRIGRRVSGGVSRVRAALGR